MCFQEGPLSRAMHIHVHHNKVWKRLCYWNQIPSLCSRKDCSLLRGREGRGGRGLDPSPLPRKPPVEAEDAKTQIITEIACTFSQASARPCAERVTEKRPCLAADNWGAEVINLMSQSVNVMFSSVKGGKKHEKTYSSEGVCEFI